MTTSIVPLRDKMEERDARRLVAMIHDGRFDEFAAELVARGERAARTRTRTASAVGTAERSEDVNQ